MGASELEGRLGRTRRERPGVPLGTYAAVEQDVSRSGWHLWLTQQDPRDGPSEGWDMWADTEEDLRALLGADGFDVEWFTDPLPDAVLDRVVGTDPGEWRFQYVSPEGAAAVLHDADVSLSEVELVGGVAVVAGLVESVWERPRRLLRGSRGVVDRFLFVLVVEPATAVQTEDPDRIDHVMIGDVQHDPDAQVLTIESAFIGSIQIATPARTYRLAIAQQPALVRRWWRWVPLDGDAPDRDLLTATAHGLVGCTRYAGPPQVNPAPSRSQLRSFGLPEPHETLEVHLADLPTTDKRAVLSRLLADLRSQDGDAELYEAKGRRGRWRRLAAGEAAAELLRAVDTDAWWNGELALILRTHRGLAVVCSAQDGQLIVVVTGGYKRIELRQLSEDSANSALSSILDGA